MQSGLAQIHQRGDRRDGIQVVGVEHQHFTIGKPWLRREQCVGGADG